MKVLYIEPTPNPEALKFNVGGRLLASGSRSFEAPGAAAGFPLIEALFGAGRVRSIFIMPSFVTVTVWPDEDWWTLKPRIQAVLEACDSPELSPDESEAPGRVDERLARIADILDLGIRPALAGDGGGLEILGLDGDELRIRYQGACGSCPSAIAGTLRAIEELLRIEVDPRLTVVSA